MSKTLQKMSGLVLIFIFFSIWCFPYAHGIITLPSEKIFAVSSTPIPKSLPDWTDDIRLTFANAKCIRPVIAVEGNTVHVVWDNRSDSLT
jgi:hypothetical protein